MVTVSCFKVLKYIWASLWFGLFTCVGRKRNE